MSNETEIKARRPWLIQPDEVYIEKGPWEELGDFERWFKEEMGEELADIYDELDAVFQTNLYALFCRVIDKCASANITIEVKK